MSRRARIAWALALIAALGASAVWLVLRDGDSETPRLPQPRSAESRDLRARAFKAAEDSARRQERRRARAEHADAEPGPNPATLRLYATAGRHAEPVARAFHEAFSRYELGQVDAAGLRNSATPSVVRELLSAPPRPLSGGRRPALARLGRLELVPVAGDRPGKRLVVVELVGTVRRGDRREPIAIEMRRREGHWLVAGLGL